MITKTGRIELEEPIRASTISLKSATLYMVMYNLMNQLLLRTTVNHSLYRPATTTTVSCKPS